MNIYNALRKLTNFCQTILHIASPNTFPYPTNDKPLLFEFNEYNMQLYHKYANPSNLIPPYDGNVYILVFKMYSKLLTHTSYILSFVQSKVLLSTPPI